MNQLYFGDNLDIMKRFYYQEHKAEFIDLIYIDPPFNSKRNYNVLFESVDMENTKAQKEAFADTWSNVSYLETLNEIKEIDLNLYHFLNALDSISISKSAISYLATMAIRIWYMHNLLKPTGSFYLHCDSTMSHYLKIVCDLIFGERNFRNEILWKRTFNSGSSKSISKKFPHNTDTIFFYSKSPKFVFNKITRPLNEGALKRYDKVDQKGRFMWVPLKTVSKERLQKLRESGEIREEPGLTYPRYKKYLNEKDGVLVDNLWDDISQMPTRGKSERLNYPTQKPEALMERIIEASSNEGDSVADFFCGCGTTIAAAQKLKRKWIGSDISHLAVKLITKRLIATYGENIKDKFEIHGFPKDIDSAKELAAGVKGGRLQFEEWIVEVLIHGVLNEKRNVMGYDGYFIFDINGNKNVALIEVKSGNATPSQLNHFIRTVEDKKAQMGIFVCFADQVTDNMRRIAKKQGWFSEHYKKDKIQILTVEDLLDGKLPDRPASRIEIFKQAERKTLSDAQQKKLF